MTFAYLLLTLGFEPRELLSSDPRETFWRQIDGDACASIRYSPSGHAAPFVMAFNANEPWPQLGVCLDLGKTGGSYTTFYVGAWSSPERAARELPEALNVAYRRLVRV